MEENKISFDEFVKELESDLEGFKSFWLKNQKDTGEKYFPNELMGGDWFEQYISYVTSKRDWK